MKKKECSECGKKLGSGNTSGKSPDHIAKRIAPLVGRKRSEGFKSKIRTKYYERKERGDVLSFKGKRHSEEHKNSMKLNGNPQWRGGKSFESYTPEFNEELREYIRGLDGHTCQLCHEEWVEGERKFAVHHIDYDKSNSNPRNLITLCASCHSDTSSRRSGWTGMFTRMVASGKLDRRFEAKLVKKYLK